MFKENLLLHLKDRLNVLKDEIEAIKHSKSNSYDITTAIKMKKLTDEVYLIEMLYKSIVDGEFE